MKKIIDNKDLFEVKDILFSIMDKVSIKEQERFYLIAKNRLGL